MLRRLRTTTTTSLVLALGLAGAAAGCADDPEEGTNATIETDVSDVADVAPAPFESYVQAPVNDDYLAPVPATDDAPETYVTSATPAAPGAFANRKPPSCLASDLKFSVWPLTGTTGKSWLINNYVDLNPAASLTKDWMNKTGSLARTYDGHRGMDVDISSFREMDANTMPVRAAAAGVVEALDESQYDRNTSCVGNWNFVKIRQDNGFAVYYGHLKKNSVVVNVGDTVAAGQKLGVAGSAGCSTQPHLHFEVQDCANVALEPNLAAMWISPPAYNAPSHVMDVMLRKDGFPGGAGQIKDPVANPTLYAPGETLGIGLSMAGKGGDTVQLSLTAPDATVDSWSWNVPGVARYSHLYPAWSKTVGQTVGTWTLRVYVNGTLETTRSFGVSHYLPGYAEVARHNVDGNSYQTVFTDITTAGYRPVWVDGFDVSGRPTFNAIFRPRAGKPWAARHGLDAAGYQTEFDYWTDPARGYRVTQVDSYLDHGNVRYAVIFTKEAGPGQTAYHGVSEATHQSQFNTLTAAHWHPVNVSVVDVGGSRRVTALYEYVGAASDFGLVAYHGIPAAQYQTEYNNQGRAGLHLKYLNAYTLNGAVFYSAIWDAHAWAASGAEPAAHGMTSAGYQTAWSNNTGAGYLTRFVTGVGAGGTAYFAALWSK
jgi:murein DD-endopeptidase MepM/ murein hydrolase activator NlpD